jgi:hypothetical protein
MNVSVLYLYPLDNRDIFLPHAKKWARTYLEHSAGYKHKVHVAFVNGDQDTDDIAIFDGIDCEFHNCTSNGFDIGAAQVMLNKIDCDYLVSGTSRQYFIAEDWLKRMVEVRKEFGHGLYGAMGSGEINSLSPDMPFPNWHLRTAFYGVDPEIHRRYPFKILNREQAYLCESGAWSQTQWYIDLGLPVRQVTWDNSYPIEQWKTVKGRFRHEQQQALIVADKHSELWAEADPATKQLWAKRAWG